jgi:hypothetical protein
LVFQNIIFFVDDRTGKDDKKKPPPRKAVSKPLFGKKKVAAAPIPEETAEIGHIMCSYCWAQQPLMIKIKTRLEEEGYKIWMDVDSMSGSTLEAMASAVRPTEHNFSDTENNFLSMNSKN